MNPKILFVDDEQNILDSLRVLLRAMRKDWDMSFATSGREALEIMRRQPQDIVISDMRMPGMDGAQLLEEVQKHWPDTVRMILSGYSEQQSVLRTVKLTHQYLSKPTRPEEIRQAILKALSLRGSIRSEGLRRAVSQLDSLPVQPALYTEVMVQLQDERVSLNCVADTISRDMAMSSSILRLVNSAFFGLPTHVSSVHHALKLLGINNIRVLVLSIGLFASPGAKPMRSHSLERLWTHSVRCACYARTIAEVEGQRTVMRDECFIAGMLHDLGKLVLMNSMPQDYDRAIALAGGGARPLHEAEREVFGASHGEVGAYLLSLWGFNDSIVEAVCWHHDRERISCADFSPLLAVSVANGFDLSPDLGAAADEGDGQGAEEGADGGCRLGELPCTPRAEYAARLDTWREQCAKYVRAGVDGKGRPEG